MNLMNYQTNFDFSRAFDFQKNLKIGFAQNVFDALVDNTALNPKKISSYCIKVINYLI